MFGDIAARSLIFGVNSIAIGPEGEETQVFVGDTVTAHLPGAADGVIQPCRLESLVHSKDCDAHADGTNNSKMIASVQKKLRR